MTKTNKRIILSAIALGLFAIYLLCDNIILSHFESYHSYTWRQGVVAGIIQLLPFIALLAGSIMEQKTQNLNPRIFPFMFVVMSIICYLTGEIFIGRIHFGYLYDTIDEFIGYGNAMKVFMIATLLVAGNMTVFSGKLTRIYAGLHMAIALFSTIVNVLLGSELGLEYSENAVASAAHLLAYCTLFSFGGIFDGENESRTVKKLISWAWPTLFDDDEEEEKETNNTPWISNVDGSSDFEKVKQWALITESVKVLYACAIIEKIGNGALLDEMGELYEKDFIAEQYVILYNCARLLNEEFPDLLSEGFEEDIASVIDDTEKRYLSRAYDVALKLCGNTSRAHKFLSSYLIQCISNREE